MDNLSEYRDFYTRRVQRLEGFKKRLCFRSSPNLYALDEDELGDSRVIHTFEALRNKMVSLMENDVTLTRQLLALGERIEQLKDGDVAKKQSARQVSPVKSSSSISSIDGEQLNNNSTSSEGAKQYFSRQNSVLRIPIPPPQRRRTKFEQQRKNRSRAKTTVVAARPCSVSRDVQHQQQHRRHKSIIVLVTDDHQPINEAKLKFSNGSVDSGNGSTVDFEDSASSSSQELFV